MTDRKPRWFWSGSMGSRDLKEGSAVWMRYITDEVRAVCRAKNWGHQIRRKSSVRETPVRNSLVDDFEWKLIPGAVAELPEEPSMSFDEGRYYVLSFRPHEGIFLFQHDTAHEGALGLHWQRATFTEISLPFVADGAMILQGDKVPNAVDVRLAHPPQEGWLQAHLNHLTSQFSVNVFSFT